MRPRPAVNRQALGREPFLDLERTETRGSRRRGAPGAAVANPSSIWRGLKRKCKIVRILITLHVANPSSIWRGLKLPYQGCDLLSHLFCREPFLDLVFRQPGRLPEQKEAGGAFY